MKKCIIALIITFLCGLSCYARQFEYDIKVGQLYYKIEGTGDDAYAKVLGGSPSMAGSLSKVVIPSSITYQDQIIPVTRIYTYAFSQEINLTDITIPSTIVQIGSYAFQDCDKLENVYIEDLTSWLTLSKGDNPLKYAKKLYVDNKLVYDIIIPDGITNIPGGCFYTFPGITSIICPSSVTTIGNQSFYQCPNLSSVQLGGAVETIGSKAFYDCRALEAIEFPQGLTTIQDYAFFSCRQLEEITIPAATISIGDNAFGYCTNLKTITSMNKRPMVIPLTTFANETYNTATLRVPAGTKSKYELSNNGWSQFANIEEMDPIIDITYSTGGSIILNNKDVDSPTTCTIPLKSDLELQFFPEARKCVGVLSINGADRTKDISLEGKITVGKVSEDLDIQATFVEACSLSLSSNEGGHLTIDDYGEDVNMIWQPKDSKHDIHVFTENGYRLKSIFVNGTDLINKLTPAGVLKIQELEEDLAIQAVFEKIWEISCEYSEGGSILINDNNVSSIIAVDGDKVKLTLNIEPGYHLSSIYANDRDVTNELHDGAFFVQGVHNDLHFKVAFMKNTYIITYLVDNEEYKTEEILFATKIEAEPTPKKEGYTFSGWSEIPETMPAHDVTVTGAFTINQYTVKFIADGDVVSEQRLEYGSKIVIPDAVDKEGYTFNGWGEVPETVPSKDLTITGLYTVNSYSLICMVDGIEYKVIPVEYGMPLTIDIVPEKEGYTFWGWDEIPETMPARDVTVTGTFTINSYSVTFQYGDIVLTTTMVEYGAVIPLPESLDSDRYTLVGWLDVPATMPARDITIYADFTDGVKAIKSNTQDAEYYQLNGVKREKFQRGLNIIRMNDGTTRKVLRK